MEAIIKSRVVGDAMPQCRSEFEAIFREKREKGAQLCCMVNGKVVVDLAGGRSAAEVFDFDRVARVYSNSKSVEALVIAMLEDRGLIKYSDSVGKLLGPDFAHLDALTVAGLMRHRGGSSCIDKKVSFEDARRIFASAAETKAWMRDSLARDFDPSRPTATTYHAITRGMFVAVIVHQLTGVEYYDFVKREILAKLGAVDFYLGDSPKDKQEPLEIAYDVKDHLWEYVLHKSGYVRWFHTPSAKAGKAAMEKHMWDWRSEGELDEIMAFITPSSVTHRSFNLLSKDRPLNAYWATALASTDGHSNARSMATIFNAAIDGTLLSKEALSRALATDGKEAIKAMSLVCPVEFSAAGWAVDYPWDTKGWAGWSGLGGSLVLFNTQMRAVFAFVPTRLYPRSESPIGLRLLRAFERDLAMQQAKL